VSSFSGYGQLSKKNIEELQSGARVEVNESKRDALDFVLWKKSKPGEPAWDSPWGAGRPGWHIECSAMGRKYLGDTFDIHGGGKDLVFPHHENEIAQSCGVTGCPPVRFWVHNGFVNIDKEKMSKSLGNFFTLRDIYKKHHPETLRLFLVSSHYRSPIDFSEKNLEDAEKVLSRFYEALADADEVLKGELASRDVVRKHPLLTKCEEAMNDDFNTSVVLALMNEELRAINTELDKIARGSGDQNKLLVCVAAFRLVGGLLGLLSSSPEKFKREIFDLKKSSLGLDVAKIEKLIKDRDLARKGQDWGRADQCRDELTQMGVVLEDTPQGTEWKIQ
jgi:cysteinyl-tRNA synthetase